MPTKPTTFKLAVIESGRPAYQLAAQAGMSESLFNRIVQGRRVPTPDELAAIALALGVPPTDLVRTDDGHDGLRRLLCRMVETADAARLTRVGAAMGIFGHAPIQPPATTPTEPR